MVCSACAYENPPGMRFCGMCGMPMPHKPITAPGANSTLNFTRVPVDAREAAAAREHTEALQTGGSVASEPGSGPVSAPAPESPGAETPATTTTASPPSPPETPAKELVPDIALDEYVRKFRYEPPQDPAEKTMRWDAPVSSSRPEPPITETPKETDHVPASLVLPNASVPASEDVDQRLGLEQESPAEASITRPRFLDLNEPASPSRPPSGDEGSAENVRPANRVLGNNATTIGGPSFLGLSDAPQSWADAIGVEHGEYAPRNYHLRAWFAVVVVLVFAGLGYLEWRAQVQQTNNGPVEVIRTKLHDWRQTATQMATPDPPPGAAKPDIQIQPQPTPSSPPPANSTASAPAAVVPQPSQASKADVDGGQSVSPPGESPAHAALPTESPTAGTDNSARQVAAEKQGAKPVDDDSEQPAPVKPQPRRQADVAASKPSALGMEEMAKAREASDPAAAAAWLWKATAKGNPDAPVQLANMYMKGDGVPRSCEQALVLLKTAAAKENAAARNRLGSMYATGTCVPASRVEAYRWYSSSLNANPNSQWTQQTRDMIWQQMGAAERAQAQRYR